MKQAIPKVRSSDRQLQQFYDATAGLLNRVTGQGTGVVPLQTLPRNATLPEVVDLLNAIVERLECE